MVLHYSPLRYPGGKTQFYNRVRDILNANCLNGCLFIEPFAGGAGVAVKLLINKQVSKIILNDSDIRIYSFWHSILNNTEKFIHKIHEIQISVEEWRRQKALLEHSSDIFERGFAAFYLNRTNRSGILSSNPIGGIKQDGKFKINCRFNKADLIRRISKIAEHKEDILIFNLDASELITKMYKEPELCDGKDTFWFIDPPYYKKGKQLYLNHFSHSDHEALRDTINEKLDSAKWILTYDVCDEISRLYKKNNSTIFSIRYSVETKRNAKEYMFYNNLIVNDT